MFTEIPRTNEQLETMLFPRLLGVAERAWHAASWEGTNDRALRVKDWERFANVIARKELQRLEKMGVSYYLPRPAIKKYVVV